MKPATKPAAAMPDSFEAALKELEAIVRTLEGGDAPLEQSLQAYERGTVLLNHCQNTLGQAEQKIRLLDKGSLNDFSVGTATEEKPA